MRLMLRAATLAALLMLVWGALFSADASASPFDASASAAAATTQMGKPNELAIFASRVQREAARRLTAATAGLKRGTFAPSLALAFVLAFAYGCVHAAGPGHGKTVVIGYFLSRDASAMRGVGLSFWIAATHVASALIVVGALSLAMHASLTALEDVREVRLTSFASISVLGLVLLAQTMRRGGRSGCAHGCPSEHDHERGAAGDERTVNAMAVVAGAVPCTGSLLVLAYTVANGLLAAGVFLVCTIGAGMALTTTALGLAARAGRRTLLGRTPLRTGFDPRLASALAYAGPLLIVGTGALLFAITYFGS